jgi:hypothetical protein
VLLFTGSVSFLPLKLTSLAIFPRFTSSGFVRISLAEWILIRRQEYNSAG